MPRRRVGSYEDIPTVNHFVLVEFKREKREVPDEDRIGRSHTVYVDVVNEYYVYSNRGEWVTDIEAMYRDNPKRSDFAFFEAGGRGSIQVQVSVSAPRLG